LFHLNPSPLNYVAALLPFKEETFYAADRGESENVHGLNKKHLADRKVVHIDIANDTVSIYKKSSCSRTL